MALITITPQTQIAVAPQQGGPVGWSDVGGLADGLSDQLLPVAGGTMTGPLILSGPPSDANGAVTLAYLNTFIGTFGSSAIQTDSGDPLFTDDGQALLID